jgi:hypothetical protein
MKDYSSLSCWMLSGCSTNDISIPPEEIPLLPCPPQLAKLVHCKGGGRVDVGRGPLRSPWVRGPLRWLQSASAHQQERRDFAVAWHPLGLPDRWTWFYRAFKSKSGTAERIEIRAEHAVIVADASAHPIWIR